MLPVLLDFKFIKIYTFGVFLVLALFWGLFLLWRNVKMASHKEEDIFDAVFTSLFGALIGARLFFVAANFSHFGFSIMKFILINGYPGLSLYGALLGGALVGYLVLLRKKIDAVHIADYIIAPLFLSMAIAKFGSFLAGVDVGSQTKSFLAIHYLGHTGNRHIIAFYESFLFLIAVYFSYRILLRIRRHILPDGFGGIFFIFYFSFVTLFLDKLKENHLYFVGFNINTTLSSISLALSGAYFVYYFRNDITQHVRQAFKNATNTVAKKTDRSGKDAS